MKLYFMPGACSLASRIALTEAGARFETEKVDGATKITETGADFRDVNPKGYVPALALDSGDVLTEGASVLQFIADTHPQSGLAPTAGTVARARLQEHLNYTASELHKAFKPFFTDGTSAAEKQAGQEAVSAKFDYVESLLADGRAYLLGDQFTVADSYLFVVSNWANFVGIGTESWPNLTRFLARVSERPSVQSAMRDEGLLAA